MADDNADLMAEFQEFLTQKRQAEKDEQSAEDFEVEIWDEKGRGVRTRRSHAKPFLQSLGIDIDAETENSDTDNSNDNAGKTKSKGSGKAAPTGSASTVRKYFTKAPVK